MAAAVDLHSLPTGSRPTNAIRNNGPDHLALERFKLRELAEGWPLYRDACEWENLASIFAPDAHIYTTWSGKVHYASFIASSQAGMDAGAFIMHRCHGISTDIAADGRRAVTKMKATITQRFTLPAAPTTTANVGDRPKDALDGKNPSPSSTCEVDAESDCRFCFFWAKQPTTITTGDENDEWKAVFVRHWYEKDKLIPVDPRKAPTLSDEDERLLLTFPSGYRWLAYCQEKTMGVKVALDMPGHRREKGVPGGSRAAGEKHDLLYWQAKHWLDGEEVEF